MVAGVFVSIAQMGIIRSQQCDSQGHFGSKIQYKNAELILPALHNKEISSNSVLKIVLSGGGKIIFCNFGAFRTQTFKGCARHVSGKNL